MSFPRYPKYKHSGVEWLGEVPEHWSISPLKHEFDIVGGSTPDSGNEDYWGGDIAWATPGDLSKLTSMFLGNTERTITAKGLASCAATLAPAGSLILSTRAPIGSLAITSVAMTTNQGCKSLVPSAQANAKYHAYTLSVSTEQLNLRGRGTTFLELSADALGAFKLPSPSPDEQDAIASFLDRETAKIDALVAEQQLLMELLKEKRQAVISHTVTKGLNPDAPMKPSGVEWLGEVPAHWTVRKAAHSFANIGSGTTPSTANREYYDDGDTRWVNTGDLNDGDLFDCDKRITQLAVKEHSTLRLYPEDSVIIAMYGATIGKLAMLRTPATVNQACCVFAGAHEVAPKFLFFWLMGYREQIVSLASGGGQPNVNQEILRALRLACPAPTEQLEITSYLDTCLTALDALATEAQRAVEVLHERRSALISAAVTGQIDVRHLAQEAAA